MTKTNPDPLTRINQGPPASRINQGPPASRSHEIDTELLRAIEDLALAVVKVVGRERRDLERVADHINRTRFLLGEHPAEMPTGESPLWPEGEPEPEDDLP